MCIRKNKKKNNICSCKIKYLFRQIGICVNDSRDCPSFVDGQNGTVLNRKCVFGRTQGPPLHRLKQIYFWAYAIRPYKSHLSHQLNKSQFIEIMLYFLYLLQNMAYLCLSLLKTLKIHHLNKNIYFQLLR